ncbi:hypothetical protein AAW14_34690 [Streptomyces hygroscopicus]|nr:hypothetical protein [Streptomyces hygroscopicus]
MRTSFSLVVSVGSESRPTDPGPRLSEVGSAAPSSLSSATSAGSRATPTSPRRSTVRAQNTFSARVWAAVTMRSIRPGGSIRSARHCTSRVISWLAAEVCPVEPAEDRRTELFVGARGQPEAQGLADLIAVILGGPAGERVLRELRGRHPHQVRDVLHRGLRDLLDELREPPLLLEELQGQGEAEPGRAVLVGHQWPVTVHRRPARHHVFR